MSQGGDSFPEVRAGTPRPLWPERRAHRPLERLAERIFPAACPGCGAPGGPLCRTCARGLVPARPAPAPAGVDVLVAPLSYEGVGRELVARLKYRNARHAVPFLAGLLADALRDLPGVERGAVSTATLTWAPTTPARRRERGFDHAELLARALGRELHRPVGALLLRPGGPAQTGRAREERRRTAPCFEPAGTLRPGPVVLTDDVVTTGSTLGAAARALRRAGATRVVGAVVARTPAPW